MTLQKLHVTFLNEPPDEQALAKLNNYTYAPDMFVMQGKEVFLCCPRGYGNTKLNNNFFENKLKIGATTLNWKTVNALVALARQS